MFVNVISGVQLCISTKTVYPRKSRGWRNTGRPLHFRK